MQGCVFLFRFVVKDRETFFTSAQRSQIVWQILMRAKYDDSDKVSFLKIKKKYNNNTNNIFDFTSVLFSVV